MASATHGATLAAAADHLAAAAELLRKLSEPLASAGGAIAMEAVLSAAGDAANAAADQVRKRRIGAHGPLCFQRARDVLDPSADADDDASSDDGRCGPGADGDSPLDSPIERSSQKVELIIDDDMKIIDDADDDDKKIIDDAYDDDKKIIDDAYDDDEKDEDTPLSLSDTPLSLSTLSPAWHASKLSRVVDKGSGAMVRTELAGEVASHGEGRRPRSATLNTEPSSARLDTHHTHQKSFAEIGARVRRLKKTGRAARDRAKRRLSLVSLADEDPNEDVEDKSKSHGIDVFKERDPMSHSGFRRRVHAYLCSRQSNTKVRSRKLCFVVHHSSYTPSTARHTNRQKTNLTVFMG
jgi:hypothetical protein